MSEQPRDVRVGNAPLRPLIAIDSDAGVLNKGEPDIDQIARQLPDWDLLPPGNPLRRGN